MGRYSRTYGSHNRPTVNKVEKPYYLEILNEKELDELAEYMEIMYQHKIIRPKQRFEQDDIIDTSAWGIFGVTANEVIMAMRHLTRDTTIKI